MEAFFAKYPQKFNEMTAVKMIHKKVEDGQHKLKKKDSNYMKCLAEALDMLETFFEEKNVDPTTLL